MAAPPPSPTSESQPDGFRTASARPECRPLDPSSPPPAVKAGSPPRPSCPSHPTHSLGHILDSLGPSVLGRPVPSWHPPARRLLGLLSHRLGACGSGRDMLLHLAGGLAPLPTGQGRGRNGGHPGTQKKGKQKETNQERRRAIRAGGGGAGSPGQGGAGQGGAGQWGSPSECNRPGDWEWRGRPEEAMRAEGSREEGERAVMQLGTNLLLLYQILSQSIGVC